MKKIYTVFVICLLLFPSSRGLTEKTNSYPVGVKMYHFDFSGRTAPVALWYPAKLGNEPLFDYDSREKKEIYWEGRKEAEPEFSQAPYPLIVFSHGMGGCGFQSVTYIENLVKAGYVVTGLDHKDSAMCRMEGEPTISTGEIVLATLKSGGDLSKTVFSLFEGKFTPQTFIDRPKDISILIDHILELNKTDPKFKGLIDPERIGVTGHSLGGYTTLAIAGAEYDCTDPAKYKEEVCKEVEEILSEKPDKKPKKTIDIASYKNAGCCVEETKGKKQSLQDKRVKAALALAPAVFFPEDAFKAVEIPLMFITGEGKFEVPIEPIQEAYDELSGPVYLIQIKKVDHMTIADFALSVPFAKLFLPGFRSKYKIKKEIYLNYSRAFFDAYLKKDSKALDYIKKPHYEIINFQAKP